MKQKYQPPNPKTMAWTLSLDDAAALCHFNREEARRILGDEGLLQHVSGRVRVDIQELVAWRKETRR